MSCQHGPRGRLAVHSRVLAATVIIAAMTFSAVQPASAEEVEEPPLASTEPLTAAEWDAINAEHGGGVVPGQSSSIGDSSDPSHTVVSLNAAQQYAGQPTYESTSSTGPTPTTQTAASPPRATPIYCRAYQDSPHRSSTIPRVINTHLRGVCPLTPTVQSLAGATYRSMWFGWLFEYATFSSEFGKRDVRLNVPFRCHNNSFYTYRTVGRFYSSFSNGYKGVTVRNTVGSARCY